MSKKTREIEENEVASWLDTQLEKLKPYSRQISLALLVIAILIAGGFLWAFLRQRNVDNQMREFQVAYNEAYPTGNPDTLIDFAAQHPDTNVAALASMNAGDLYLKSGLEKVLTDRIASMKLLKNAKENYQAVINANNSAAKSLRDRAVASMAYTCESMGNYDEAKEFYDQLREAGEDNPFFDFAVRAIDRCDLAVSMDFNGKLESIKIDMSPIAPGEDLPRRPDISFPEPGDNNGSLLDGLNGENDTEKDGDAENDDDAPPQLNSSDDDSDSDPKKEEESGDNGAPENSSENSDDSNSSGGN